MLQVCQRKVRSRLDSLDRLVVRVRIIPIRLRMIRNHSASFHGGICGGIDHVYLQIDGKCGLPSMARREDQLTFAYFGSGITFCVS